jgi:hypothetical protein
MANPAEPAEIARVIVPFAAAHLSRLDVRRLAGVNQERHHAFAAGYFLAVERSRTVTTVFTADEVFATEAGALAHFLALLFPFGARAAYHHALTV